ncbi:MAG: VanZ family protein [Clostridiales Family XIII bacterium]|jgi:VanZ family protein|nr:VanZ family protein [Clostridiales Family XIII bacterium]
MTCTKKKRILSIIITVLFAACIVVVSSIPSDALPSRPSFINVIAHFFEYFILAILLTIDFQPTGVVSEFELKSKKLAMKSAIIAIVIASIFSVTDEIHQYFVPGRVCDPLDWLTDTAGALVGSIIITKIIASGLFGKRHGKE